MKRYISFFIIATLIFTMFTGIGGTAYAAGVTLSISPGSVNGTVGATYELTATISTDIAITGYRVVRVANDQICGEPVEAQLLPGDPGYISFQLTVEQGMVGGEVDYRVQYKTETSDWTNGGTDSVQVVGLTPAIACSVTASRTLAAAGDQITFAFKIENQGDVDLTNIQIYSDSLKKGSPLNTSPWTITSKHSYDWSYKYSFTAPKTVSFYITYTANGSSGRYDVPQQFELKEEERKVKATLSVDDSTPDSGQEVTFTLKITNEGNVDYTNLTVTWDGEDMGSPSRSLAQNSELEKKYKRTFTASTDVKFTITMKDHTGQTRTVSTNTIRILLPIDAGALQGGLKLVIEPDRNEFTSAGVVTFSGYISNDSEYTLSEVSVTEASLGDVYTVSEMAADSKLPISYPVDINGTTTYTFTLSVKDRNGQVYTINAEPITVTIQSSEEATADPAGDAPVVTLPPDGGAPNPLLAWFIIAGVLVLLIIVVGAALVVLWRNGRSPSRSSRSMAPKAKRPVRGGYNKSIKSRSFRDRNNF